MNAIMENVDVPSNVKSKLPKEVSDNLNIVFNLSKDMGVDIEYMKRYYCCMLYALDYHSEAEKVKTSLNIKNGEIFPQIFNPIPKKLKLKDSCSGYDLIYY